MPNLLISDNITKSWKKISVEDARTAWIGLGFPAAPFDERMRRSSQSDWSAVCKLVNGEVIVRMAD